MTQETQEKIVKLEKTIRHIKIGRYVLAGISVVLACVSIGAIGGEVIYNLPSKTVVGILTAILPTMVLFITLGLNAERNIGGAKSEIRFLKLEDKLREIAEKK